MNTVTETQSLEKEDYLSMFPTDQANPRDAAEALLEKISGFEHRGLFQVDGFLEVFSRKCREIVIRILPDKNAEDLQREMAYMIHRLRERYNIIMALDIISAEVRAMEEILDVRGILQRYHAFSEGKTQTIEGFDEENAALYLRYLFFRASFGLKQVIEYLEMCIGITQHISNGISALGIHLHDNISHIPFDSIEPMLANYSYLGGGKDKYEQLRLQIIQDNPGISGTSVSNVIEMHRQYFAAFHVFILGFFEDYIRPYSDIISPEEKEKIRNLLADFCDLVDPGMCIPISMYNHSSYLEFEMRNQMFISGKVVH